MRLVKRKPLILSVRMLLSIFITLLFVVIKAQSQTQGFGRVNMQGSIIDTACAIDVRDYEQSITLPAITTGDIIHDGSSGVGRFSIHLVNCSLAEGEKNGGDKSWFSVTFDGERNANLFGVSGADGLGIQIKDSEGNVAQPGIPLPQGRLVTEGQTLNYTLHLISNHHEFKAGDYRAAIRFKVDYY